jgi:thiol-disulfide isomerase/thioredoxin
MSMRRSLPRLAAVVLAVATLTLSACTSDGSDSKTFTFTSATGIGKVIPPADRKPAAAIDGKLLDSSAKTTLAQRKGKPVVLAFWASWCGPCRVEMPLLNTLDKELKSSVSFLGVNTKDDKASAAQFVKANDIAFPSVYDQQGDTTLKLGNIPGSLPFTVLIDKSGRVAAVYVARYAPKDLTRALDALRAES